MVQSVVFTLSPELRAGPKPDVVGREVFAFDGRLLKDPLLDRDVPVGPLSFISTFQTPFSKRVCSLKLMVAA